MINVNDIRLIAFDADDTLWDCQGHFDEVERQYCEILSPWGTAKEVSDALFQTESGNMALMGYGCKAFTISIIENAIRFSHGEIKADDVMKIVELGKSLLELPATPLPGVAPTLQALRQLGRYRMVVFTKGELLDQQTKVIRSGLSRYFDDVVIVTDKTKDEYQKLCHLFDTTISHLLMVGNSFRSDIEPVLQLGGYAAHIPFHTEWKHEATEEYDHPHLWRLQQFEELQTLVSNLGFRTCETLVPNGLDGPR